MTISELGSLGELLSAVIVAATLIYLAIQSKQNQKLLQSNSFQTRAASLIDLYKSMALSHDFSSLVVKREKGQELDDIERQQQRFLNLAYFRQIENVHFQMDLGILEGDVSARLVAVGAQLRNDPTFREDYEWSRNQYREEFIDLMDSYLDEAGKA